MSDLGGTALGDGLAVIVPLTALVNGVVRYHGYCVQGKSAPDNPPDYTHGNLNKWNGKHRGVRNHKISGNLGMEDVESKVLRNENENDVDSSLLIVFMHIVCNSKFAVFRKLNKQL